MDTHGCRLISKGLVDLHDLTREGRVHVTGSLWVEKAAIVISAAS